MSSMDLATIEDRIAAKIDPATTGELAVSDAAGGLVFANVSQVMDFSKLMAVAQIGIRKHLRGNVGACLAVCVQAIEWRMSPFAVANKSYLVNDQIAYEAQLIHAVILQRAPIRGRVKHEYTGDGEKRQLRVWAELRDEPGEMVEYKTPLFKDITPKNSPLWKSDPEQQLHYFAVRAWCRRHFPDVLLGVYAHDELPQDAHVGADRAKDVTPLAQRLAAARQDGPPATGFNPAFVDAEIDGAAPEPPEPPASSPPFNPASSSAEDDTAQAGPGGASPAGPADPSDDAFPGDTPPRGRRKAPSDLIEGEDA